MKALFTILSLFTCTALTAQCRPGIDTVKAKMDIKVGTNVWDYYNPNGVPAWKGVKGYDSTLIPKKGYAVQRTKIQAYSGYVVYHVAADCVAVVAEMLDSKKKRIKGFLIFHSPYN